MILVDARGRKARGFVPGFAELRRFACVLACLILASHSLLAHDPHDPFNVIAVSPNFAQDHTVLAATGQLSIKIDAQALLKSIDGGITWSVLGLQTNSPLVALAFSPAYAQDQTIFAGGPGGLFRSTNQGSSWTLVTSKSILSLALSPNFAADNTLVMVVSPNVIQKSTNRGQTLTTMPAPGGLTAGLSSIAISPNFDNDNTLLVGGAADGLFLSANGGSTWALASSGLTLPNVTAVAFSPNFVADQTAFAATYGSGVLVSANGAATWAPSNAGLSDLNVSDLAFSVNYASNTTLWVTSATGGVSQSTNAGMSWGAPTTVSRTLSSLTSTHYQAIATGASGSGDVLYLAMFEGLWTFSNNGAAWQYLETLPTRLIRYINVSPGYANDQTVFANTYGGGNLWTTNGGTTWTFQNAGMQGPYTDASGISSNYPVDGTAFSSNYLGLQRTIDRGNSWQMMNGPPAGNGYPRSMAVSPNYANDSTVFIGTITSNEATPIRPDGRSVPAGLWISKDGGNNWTLSSLTVGITSISFSPTFASDHTVFAASYTNGMFRSTDGGTTWTQQTLPTGQTGVVKVAVSSNFASDRIVLAAGPTGGILRSANAGATWNKNYTVIRALDIQFSPNFATDQTVFVGSAQDGLMMSTDGGRNFNTVTTFPDSFVLAVGISPNFASDRTIFAAGYHGLFKSIDGGNTWAYTTEPARIEESRNVMDNLQDPPTISYQGLWTFPTPSLTASTNAYAVTSESADTATVSFTGSGIRWISWTGPNQGSATIQLDGVSEGTVSLTAPTDQFQSVWEQHGIPCGPHTFAITGQPQTGQTVALDAFDVWSDTCPLMFPANAATLGTNSATVGNAEGIGSVLLLTSGSWVATPNAPWLHLLPGSSSGFGSALILYSYDANPNSDGQVGTLTIAGLTFIVTQAGSTYVAVSPQAALLSSGLNGPQGLAIDSSGNVYVANTRNNTILQWSAFKGQVAVVVQNGLNDPAAVALDTQGNLYIADTGNNAIEKFSVSTGQLTTLVANLSGPSGIGLDPQGNVYFSDTGNGAIKVVNPSTLVVNTLAQNLVNPTGLAVDEDGNIFFAETANNDVKMYSTASQQVSVLAAGLVAPAGVAVDGHGNVYIAGAGDSTIRQWNAGTQSLVTLSIAVANPVGIAVDWFGNVYVTSQNSNTVTELILAFLSLGANSKTESPQAGRDSVPAFVLPMGTPLTPSSDQSWLTILGTAYGSINFAFTANNTTSARVAHIMVLGQQITVTQRADTPFNVTKSSGDGQSTSPGQPFATPLQVNVTDPFGSPIQGAAVTFSVTAGTSGAGGTFGATPPMPILSDQNGNATAPALTANAIAGQFLVTAGVNGLTVTFTLINSGYALGTSSIVVPATTGSSGVSLAAFGSWTATSNASWLHIASGSAGGTGNTLVQFTYDANSSPAAQSGTLTIAGLTLTVTQAGTAYQTLNLATTPVAAGLSAPMDVAVDAPGNIYIADTGHNAVEEWVTANQQLVTLVGSGLNAPASVAVDPFGNVYVADTGNGLIKEYIAATKQLNILPVTGLTSPAGIALDAQGNLYIADKANNTLVEWNTANGSTILVGSGLNSPTGVAVNVQGNVYIADTGNNAIKCWNLLSGQTKTLVTGLLNPEGVVADGLGNIYFSDSGNNQVKQWNFVNMQPALSVSSGLNNPAGVTLDTLGNLYVADTNDNAIREYGVAYLSLGGPSGVEGPEAGSDSFSALVLPAATPLNPTSDQPWLTVTGAAGGVVSFSFSSNESSSSRTAHVYVLGQPVTITQGANTFSMVKSGGDGQGVPVNQAFPTLLAVKILDESAVPVPGAQVTFTVTPGQNGAGGAFAAVPPMPVTADANGNAVAPVLTANAATGTFTVTASVQNISAPPVTFTLTNLAYTLASSSASVPATAGSGSVLLLAAGPWTASSNASWLQILPGSASGTGNAMIQFSYAANPNTAAQTGTLTISGLTFTVTQAGTSALPASLMQTLASVGLKSPQAVAVDAQGNLYIADTSNNAVKKWTAATKLVTPLVILGLNAPRGIAVDAQGNVYIADSGNNAIKVWSASTQLVTPLVSSGINSPGGVAVDSLGNVYFSDTGHNAIKEYPAAAPHTVATLVTGLSNPQGVAVDALGNVYFADAKNNAIKEWAAAPPNAVTTLVSSGLNLPHGVAVDADGNVYIADMSNNAVKEWTLQGQITTLVSSGLKSPSGVAVDQQGNVDIADAGNNAVKEFSAGYITLGATSINLTAPAGTGSVTIAALPLTLPVIATSDRAWLTITGTSGGAVGFSFTANTSANSRTAHITVLGQTITVTQAGDIPVGIAHVGGNNQTVTSGQAYPIALMARVTDAAGAGIGGVPVTFAVAPGATASGAFAPSVPVLTNNTGYATASTLTATGTAGTFAVTATAGSLTTTFKLTVTN